MCGLSGGEPDNLEKIKHELWEKVKTCVRLIAKKTKVITQYIFPEHPPLATTGDTLLKEVRDFKYLGLMGQLN